METFKKNLDFKMNALPLMDKISIDIGKNKKPPDVILYFKNAEHMKNLKEKFPENLSLLFEKKRIDFEPIKHQQKLNGVKKKIESSLEKIQDNNPTNFQTQTKFDNSLISSRDLLNLERTQSTFIPNELQSPLDENFSPVMQKQYESIKNESLDHIEEQSFEHSINNQEASAMDENIAPLMVKLSSEDRLVFEKCLKEFCVQSNLKLNYSESKIEIINQKEAYSIPLPLQIIGAQGNPGLSPEERQEHLLGMYQYRNGAYLYEQKKIPSHTILKNNDGITVNTSEGVFKISNNAYNQIDDLGCLSQEACQLEPEMMNIDEQKLCIEKKTNFLLKKIDNFNHLLEIHEKDEKIQKSTFKFLPIFHDLSMMMFNQIIEVDAYYESLFNSKIKNHENELKELTKLNKLKENIENKIKEHTEKIKIFSDISKRMTESGDFIQKLINLNQS
jgi:hypothetical protein